MAGAAVGGAIGAAAVYALTAGVARLILEVGLSRNAASGGEGKFELSALSYLGASTTLAPLGSALSVWLGGRSAGGNANYGLTLLGSLTGALVGGGAAVPLLLEAEFDEFLWSVPLIAGVFQYAGGLLAYHFSDKARAAHRVQEDETTLLIEPYFASSHAGFALGLGGRF